MSGLLEKDIEQSLVKRVKARGGWCLKWVCPGFAGVPDRIVLLPGGHIMFVELKRPGGSLSPLQLHWHKMLRSMGFGVYVLWSLEDVRLFDDALAYRGDRRHE